MRNLLLFLTLSLCLLLSCLLPVSGLAEEIEKEKNIYSRHLLKLQQTYSEFRSIVFSFEQVTRSGSRSRSGRGDAVFVRLPDEGKGIMRWNYTYPDFQIILNDGQELSIYNQRDNQLIVTPAEEFNQDITFGLLTGDRELNDDFIAGPPDDRFQVSPIGGNLRAIQLLPGEPHPQIKSIQLWFDEDYLIKYLVLVDHFESITELMFSDNIINTIDAKDMKKVGEVLFLDIPQGTEIIRP